MPVTGGGDSANYLMSWSEVRKGLLSKREDSFFLGYIKRYDNIRSLLKQKRASKRLILKVCTMSLVVCPLALFLLGVNGLVLIESEAVGDKSFFILPTLFGAIGSFVLICVILDAYLELRSLKKLEKRHKAIMAQ